MRATGIVRRIDELGRVVIPKEIRRTLRIREGDPLEIYTENNGEVVLKKYSPIGEIAQIAKDYSDSLYRALGHSACVCNRDAVVSVSGAVKKDLLQKPLSPEVENAMQSRQVLRLSAAEGSRMVPLTRDDDPAVYTAQSLTPVISDGEVIGALVLVSRDAGARMSDTDMKVAETTAALIGRQMEAN